MTKERPVDWLPRNHDDVERAQALLERPADDLAPVIPELIRWLKNDACPQVLSQSAYGTLKAQRYQP